MPTRRERLSKRLEKFRQAQLQADALAFEAQRSPQGLPPGVIRTSGGALAGIGGPIQEYTSRPVRASELDWSQPAHKLETTFAQGQVVVPKRLPAHKVLPHAGSALNEALAQEQLAGRTYRKHMIPAQGEVLSTGRARELMHGPAGTERFMAQMQLTGRPDVARAVSGQMRLVEKREAAILERYLMEMSADPDFFIQHNPELYRMLVRGTTNPEAWEEAQRIRLTSPVRVRKESPWGPRGEIIEENIWKPYLRAMQQAEKIAPGIVAALGKPEHIITGQYIDPKKLRPIDVSPAGEFIRRNKAAAYHILTNPTMPPEGVAAWSSYRFNAEIPRVALSPTMAEARTGGLFMGRPMEVMARQVVVSPGQAWSQAVAGGALETEHAFVNEHLRNVAYNIPRSTDLGYMGQGQAVTDVLAQRRLVAGQLSAKWSEQTGIDVLTSGRLMANPMAAMQGMVEHMVTLADVNQNRQKISHLQQRLKQAGVAELQLLDRQVSGPVAVWNVGDDVGLYAAGARRMEEHIASIGMGPHLPGTHAGVAAARYEAMSPHQKALRGAFMLLREISRDIGIEQPYAHAEFTTAGGRRVTGRAIVGGLRPRFEHMPSYRGMRVDPSALLGLASQGPEAAEVAEAFLAHGHRVGGKRAREFFAFLNPALGRTSAYEGFQRITAGEISGDIINRLAKPGAGWDVWELGMLLGEPDIPNAPLLLKLPEPIRMPNIAALSELQGKGADEATRAAVVSRQGAPTRVLALPNIRATMEQTYVRALEEGTDKTFLTPLVGQAGKVIEAVRNWEAGVSGAGAAAVEREVATYVDLMAGHTSGKGLVHDLLNPRATTGGAYYRGLTQGQLAANLPVGTVAAGQVGMAEVGLSATALREDYGYSERKIEQLLAGKGEAYLYLQGYPQVSPGTSGVVRVQAFPDEILHRKQVVTHAANRSLMYRDVDVDPAQLQHLPPNINQATARRAYEQNLQMTQEMWKNMPPAAREVWLAQEAAYARQEPLSERAFRSTLDEALATGENAGLTDSGAKKVLKAKAMPGILYEETMRAREIMFQQAAERGHSSYPGQAVMGPAVQMAGIKKTQADAALGELHAALKAKVPGKALTEAEARALVPEILPIAERLAAVGAKADVHTAVSGARLEEGVLQAIHGYSQFNREREARTVGMHRLGGGGQRVSALEMMQAIEDPRTGYRQTQWRSLTGLGERTTPGVGAANRSAQVSGEAGRAAGGVLGKATRFWNQMPGGLQTAAKWTAGGLGALLGLRVLKSTLFGDEPVGRQPAMRPLSPESQARMALQQTGGLQGSALPPDPLVGDGIHGQAHAPAYVPMSPPRARVMDPLRLNPKMRVQATDTTNMDPGQLAGQMAASMRTSSGVPSVDIFAPDDRLQSRLALNTDLQMRRESRFYAV
jgi:hypothetical protein